MARPVPRLALLLGAQLSLIAGLWAGLLRLPLPVPTPGAALLPAHGPLMVCAFAGTLVALERAVALGRGWAYLAPLFSTLGGVLLLAPAGNGVAQAAMVLAAFDLSAVQIALYRKQPGLELGLMTVGAISWLGGNLLWLWGWPLSHAVSWWIAFLLLTIASERLQLGRVLRISGRRRALFAAFITVTCASLPLGLASPLWGRRLGGVGIALTALWLLRHDIARINIGRPGLPRFSASALLAGHVWLCVAGLLRVYALAEGVGPRYDAALHAFFVGFVISMIFGHAPVILPTIIGRPLPYRRAMFAPLALLHLSLLARVVGDLALNAHLRQAGGATNAAAILLFFATALAGVLRRTRS